MNKKYADLPLRGVINVMGYTPPKLHEGKTWYIDYFFTDRECNRRRKKHIIPAIKPVSRRRSFAREYLSEITIKLAKGWNPFEKTGGLRNAMTVTDALALYERHIEHSDRMKTYHNYHSRLNIFRNYLSELQIPPVYCYDLDTALYHRFLDWLVEEREVGPRTVNNYRGWLSSLSEFFVSRGILSDNPASRIKKVRADPKRRQAIPESEVRRSFAWLREHDRSFLLACMMEYHTFVRPTELSHIRISDISLKDREIFISGDYSKNHKDGKVALCRELVHELVDSGVLMSPGHYYLFGKGFTPSEKKQSGDIFCKRFTRLRKSMGWPSTYKFYSYKDSGIRDLANEHGIVVARDQARHSDISTTNKYLGRDNLRAPEEVKRR